jgi:LacI family transcriptional regulator
VEAAQGQARLEESSLLSTPLLAELFGNMAHSPTIRTLAQALKLAPSTVSAALTGRGRVGRATAKRVRELARRLGYHANPLTATVLGELRRARGAGYRGAIATLDLHEPTHWPHGPFPEQMVIGARERAVQLGFSIEEFVVGSPTLSLHRFDGILRSRGIHGIIVLPSWQPPDLAGMDWSRYAGIYTDSVTCRPALHSVCLDHYGSMIQLLERLVQRGYRRPGLIMERGRDLRIQHRQTAAFQAFPGHHPCIAAVPVLFTPGVPDLESEFAPWFREHRPDVVLSHFVETQDWLRMLAGRGGPPGFVLLNVLESRQPCAAIDLQPRVLGARAAELLVGQILRGDFGVPAWPSRNMILASWVEGPTVRPSAAS